LPAAETQAAQRPLIPLAYLLIVLISLVTACGWGIRRFQFRRQQQKIEQDQLDVVNALKRESIKNRLKPLTD
jgi:flagellar biogenesis protein FliO